MTISERIVTLLRTTGNTQKSIADLLKVQPSTVNTWLKGNAESIPSAYVMPIARFFNITPEELLEGVIETRMSLGDDEKRLINIFRNLDYESQILVIATAVTEHRRTHEHTETEG